MHPPPHPSTCQSQNLSINLQYLTWLLPFWNFCKRINLIPQYHCIYLPIDLYFIDPSTHPSLLFSTWLTPCSCNFPVLVVIIHCHCFLMLKIFFRVCGVWVALPLHHKLLESREFVVEGLATHTPQTRKTILLNNKKMLGDIEWKWRVGWKLLEVFLS